MKIKTVNLPYDEAIKKKAGQHKLPVTPAKPIRRLLKAISVSELKETQFTCKKTGMDKLPIDQPALFLMNHSCFTDLKIAFHELYPRKFNIVCTSDGFVGKESIMRMAGCIPTKKFITDTTLVKDIFYAVNELHNSILMYPEASYSFDGTATTLPDSLGKFIKKLNIPVVMIKTSGAFARDPLYNMLQLRKVKISAEMKYLLSSDDIEEKSANEINDILKEQFTFDNFRWQIDNDVKITEGFRADGLNRVLYKCPCCNKEGKMLGKGTSITCNECNEKWELNENGSLSGKVFNHVPDWYKWERDCVRDEIEKGSYSLDVPVDIKMLVDTKALYAVGSGQLTHSKDGFHLTGCDGKLDYVHTPAKSYSLYADYYWYEIGDMICIGNSKVLYYCFPKVEGDIVAKTRLACEELYKSIRINR